MLLVEDSIQINASMEDVFEHCWNAEAWPKITDHVKRIGMIEKRPDYQRFMMTVAGSGIDHVVESTRYAERYSRIRYIQLKPPIALRDHQGEWLFAQLATGVAIRLIHRAVLDEAVAPRVLGVDSLEHARATVATMFRSNGR